MFERGWTPPRILYGFFPCWAKQSLGPNVTVKVVDPETARAWQRKHERVCVCALIGTHTSDERSSGVVITDLRFSNYNRDNVQLEMTSFQLTIQCRLLVSCCFICKVTQEASRHSQRFLRRRSGKSGVTKGRHLKRVKLVNYAREFNRWNERGLMGD